LNLEANPDKFLLSLGVGRFLFVDFNWVSNPAVAVTWRIKDLRLLQVVVGVYQGTRFHWDFQPLRILLTRFGNIGFSLT
jgi:hypothetical protein